MNPRAIGISLDWEACLPLVKASGFEGIDVPVDPLQPAAYYRDHLQQYGLKPGGMGLPLHMSDPEAKAADALAKLPALSLRSQEIGQNRFYTWILPFSDQLPRKENFAFHVERLGKAARILAENGCRLGLEFIGPRSMREGRRYSFAHTLEEMLELCQAVGPNVGLLLDAWHWHTSLGTLDELHELSNQQVVYVHINDAPAGVPLEQQQDLVRRLPGETGVIDLPGFLGALRAIGYDGPVVPEPFVPSLAEMPPADAARRVGAAMRAVWQREKRPALPAAMQAVATGGGKAWLVELPVPKPEGSQVVIKLHASPICGSNLGSFLNPGEWVNVGHEGAGEVVAVAQSNRLKVGDRVALAPLTSCGCCEPCLAGDVIFCQDRPQAYGNFAQFTKTNDLNCTLLPDDIDYDTGSLLGCCLGPAYSAIKQLNLRPLDTLVVAGLGPVGLGATALAAFFGAQVIALDPEPYRQDLARQLGAAAILDPTGEQTATRLLEATGGKGVTKAIECSGKPQSQRLLIDLAAVHGRIAFVGENQDTIPVSPSRDFIRKGLTLFGCWHMNVHDADELIPFLRRSPQAANLLISHRFGFSQVQQAFELFATRQTAKVLLKPWE